MFRKISGRIYTKLLKGCYCQRELEGGVIVIISLYSFALLLFIGLGWVGIVLALWIRPSLCLCIFSLNSITLFFFFISFPGKLAFEKHHLSLK